MNHKTDMQAALQACVDVLLHDGVPTDPEHPKRIALNAAEAALAYRPDAQENLASETVAKDSSPKVSQGLTQADERGAFDIALNALQQYQDEWDTGLPSEYAQSERIQMECACEAVREALQEVRAAAPQAEAAQGVPENIAEGLEILDNFIASVRKNGNYSPETTLNFIGQARQCFVAAPSRDREQMGEDAK